LRVLPQQTVLESAQLEFPAVKTETKFLVQWIGRNDVIGKMEVLVYPTNRPTGQAPPGGRRSQTGQYQAANQYYDIRGIVVCVGLSCSWRPEAYLLDPALCKMAPSASGMKGAHTAFH
jgi:hypothetical protein